MNGEKQDWFVSYLASRKGYERRMYITKVMAFDEAGANEALLRHVANVLTPEMGICDVKIVSTKGGAGQ